MKNLVIYTAKNCPYSQKILAFLYENELPFIEVKLEENKEAVKEIFEVMKEVRTPTVAIDEGAYKIMTLGWNDQNKKRILAYGASLLGASS